MKYYPKALTALFLATVSTVAMADPLQGPYVTLGVGANHPMNFAPTGAPGGTSWSYKWNTSDYLAGGYSFGNGIRAEAEFGYLQSHVNNYGGAANGATGGMARQFYYMANGIYDFDNLGLPFGIVPHLGAGVGVATLHEGSGGPAASETHVGGTRFAWQGIAGVEYPLQALPGLNLGLEYRFVETVNSRASVGPYSGHGDFQTNNIFVTARYTFAPPPPPPPPPPAPVAAPAPAPEPQRAFQVFFDFDKSNITAEAAATIAKAASAVQAGHMTRIDVTGHTDTVGSVKYNLGLSQRRAAAVKRQLMADGISAEEIGTTGVGKSGLLVPTPDGVREPQNRRAEIVLH